MKKTFRNVKGYAASFVRQVMHCARVVMFAFLMVAAYTSAFAQDAAAGVTALGGVTDTLKLYVEPATQVCYALAGIIAIVGSISVYIKMNNEEQDVKKSIMMLVGACVFLIAAAQALPAIFGL